MKIIGYFKQILPLWALSTPKSTLEVVSRPIQPMTLFVLLASCLSINLIACSQITVPGKVSHSLIRSSAPNGENSAAQLNKTVNLNGMWKIGFRYNGKSGLGSMQIQQNDQNFVGSGKDDDHNATFKIDHGLIKGNEIIFLKRYDSSPNQAVQYHGKFSCLPTENGQRPYMGGDYSVEVNGNLTVGDWEAAKDEVKNAPAVAVVKNNEREQSSSEQDAVPSSLKHSPDLSGKWNVAYEYNFKTAHSVMFLEQNSNKLSGHGFDLNSKEKFVINKGWYNFPHVTIVRQYISGAEPGRTMTFKADVAQVSDEDYTGPYLSGKTQGGGDWEAERVY